jgi:hypothetical protein
MINGIKCSGKIKKTQARNFLLATGSDEKIMNSKKSSFCRMEFDFLTEHNLLNSFQSAYNSDAKFNYMLIKYRKERN